MAPTPVLSPGKSHGRRSLVGCSLWGRKDLDTTERLHLHFSLSCTGEGNGNPLQCSCLENPRDGGAWWAAVYAVTQSWTWLKWLSSCSSSWLRCFKNFLILKQYSAVSPKVPSKKNSENSKRLCVHTPSIAKVLKDRRGNLRNVVSCFTNDVQNISLKGGMGVCLRETSNISGQSGKYYLLSAALRTDFLRQYLNPGKATFFSVTIKYYMSASD